MSVAMMSQRLFAARCTATAAQISSRPLSTLKTPTAASAAAMLKQQQPQAVRAFSSHDSHHTPAATAAATGPIKYQHKAEDNYNNYDTPLPTGAKLHGGTILMTIMWFWVFKNWYENWDVMFGLRHPFVHRGEHYDVDEDLEVYKH